MKFSNKKLVELFILVLIANLQLSLGARKENEKQINQFLRGLPPPLKPPPMRSNEFFVF